MAAMASISQPCSEVCYYRATFTAIQVLKDSSHCISRTALGALFRYKSTTYIRVVLLLETISWNAIGSFDRARLGAEIVKARALLIG
jgi:hypothetical protein